MLSDAAVDERCWAWISSCALFLKTGAKKKDEGWVCSVHTHLRHIKYADNKFKDPNLVIPRAELEVEVEHNDRENPKTDVVAPLPSAVPPPLSRKCSRNDEGAC